MITHLCPIFLLSLLLTAACTRLSDDGDRLTQDDAGDDPVPDSVHTVTDDLERSLRLDAPPRRIVSLAPSLTEMLFALGADSCIVGVTSYCDYPPRAAERSVVGDLVTPDIERILALAPDLILISVEGNSERTFGTLKRLGLRVFVSNPRDIPGVYKSLRDIGSLTGREKAATTLVDSLRRVELHLRKTAAGDDSTPSVLMLLSLQPLMAAGRDTFIDEIITLAGARNAAADLRGAYPTLNREILLRMNADVILYPDDMGVSEERMRSGFPEWRELRAMQRKHVHRIDADVYLRPGPRVFQAASELQALIR
ncbi:MAG: cobalamin-binding protein [Bacteroidetes bacterium]|nr:cobalamin-binding protein [Bacteroidota bacterium]